MQRIKIKFKKQSIALLFLSSVFFSLIILEIIVRLFFPVPLSALFATSTKSWQKPDQDLTLYFNESHFRPSAELGYEFLPLSKLGTNSLGMLDKERLKEKQTDVYRIICLGDSTLCGDKDPKKSYAGILEEILNEQKHGKDFEVWNCGVPGYGTIQICRALEQKWLDFDPDLVVINFCLNDFAVTPVIVREDKHFVGYYPNHELKKKINPFFLKHSAAYRLAIAISLKLNRSYKQDAVVKASTERLKAVKNTLNQKNIPYVVVIVGLTRKLSEYPPYFQQQYRLITDILKKNSIEYIDMVPLFEKNDPESLVLHAGDEIHFNQKGRILVAEKIQDHIKNSLLAEAEAQDEKK